jgi:hypothetical protein
MSVAQVVRRYAMNANLIFKWLKDPRFAPEAEVPEQEATFLPIEIEADAAVEPASIDMPMVKPTRWPAWRMSGASLLMSLHPKATPLPRKPFAGLLSSMP